MKKWILCFLLGVPVTAWSAPKGAASKRPIVTLKWPTFRQSASTKAAPEIKAVQFLLRSRGFYKFPIDGLFGARTAASVCAFQRKNGLKVDGIVASQTFSKLIQPLKRGAKGDAVRALQVVLNDTLQQSEVHGVSPVKVDGVFGFQTEEAIRVHQRILETKENGTVSARIWCDLFGGDSNYFL